MATTGICNSFKAEVLQGGHCFNATQSAVSCAGTSGQFTLTSLASTAGLAVGMAATGTGVAAGAVIASVDSASQVTLSKAHTGTVSSATFTADAFKMALVKASPSLTYSATQTNIGTPGTGSPSTSNLGTDEPSGSGYTSGGMALTNVQPALSSTTATTSFSPSPSLTSATISCTAGIIWNTSTRLGAAATPLNGGGGLPLNGRTVSVHDFGGTQTVTGGTITFTMPTNGAGTAIIQIA
jgi:hypothetical protein